MGKLHQKKTMQKPLDEITKKMRQASLEERCTLDTSDILLKWLGYIQQSIKVNSLSGMVDMLDVASRNLGLGIMETRTGKWAISSDMFYLEISLKPDGIVRSVKINYGGNKKRMKCPEIMKLLNEHDVKEFIGHLQGLLYMHRFNTDKFIKIKMFSALQALEADLALMASTYSSQSNAELLIMKSLLGYFQPMCGGHQIKLLYYVSPYAFFEKKTGSCIPNDINEIVKRQIGISATVSIQFNPGINMKLQTRPTVTIMRTPDGKTFPSYGSLNGNNSLCLPASFQLNLEQPIPIFKKLLHSIQSVIGTEKTICSHGEKQSILNLVTRSVVEIQSGNSDENRLFVALPGQNHCYLMIETPGDEGELISSVFFSSASQLPRVITLLRQQLTFNTLVASCVRRCSKPDKGSIMFEISTLSHHNLSVSFKHDLYDSLITLEIDMKDISNLQCKIHGLYSTTKDMIPALEKHGSLVIQRSMSLPIMARAIINRWQSMDVKSDILTLHKLPLSVTTDSLESQQPQQQTINQKINPNPHIQTVPSQETKNVSIQENKQHSSNQIPPLNTILPTNSAAEEPKRKVLYRIPSMSITRVNTKADSSPVVNPRKVDVTPDLEIIPLPNPAGLFRSPYSTCTTPITHGNPSLHTLHTPAHTHKVPSVMQLKLQSRLQGKKLQHSLKPIHLVMKPLAKLHNSTENPRKVPSGSYNVKPKYVSKKSLMSGQISKKANSTSINTKPKLQSQPSVRGSERARTKKEQLGRNDLHKASSSNKYTSQKNDSRVNEYNGISKRKTNKSTTVSKIDTDSKKATTKRTPGQKFKPIQSATVNAPKRPYLKEDKMKDILFELFNPRLERKEQCKDSPKFDLRKFQIPKTVTLKK